MRALACLLVVVATPAFAQADVHQKLDALYARRHERAQLEALEEATAEALKAHPDDYGVLWRASRLKYWLGDGATHEKMKERFGKEGWDLAERAIQANPKGIEGHYYAAISIGVYSQAVGIMTALGQGLEGRFNERLDKALSIDPAFDNAGPLIAKGRYWYELPWPKRDLDKSKATLKKATQAQPKALRAWLYLAETLLKDGKPEQAKEAIDKVFAGSEAYDVAEARRVKSWAKSVKNRIEEELK